MPKLHHQISAVDSLPASHCCWPHLSVLETLKLYPATLSPNTAILLPQMPEFPLNLKDSLVIPRIVLSLPRDRSSSRNLADFHHNKLLPCSIACIVLSSCCFCRFRAIDQWYDDYKPLKLSMLWACSLIVDGCIDDIKAYVINVDRRRMP